MVIGLGNEGLNTLMRDSDDGGYIGTTWIGSSEFVIIPSRGVIEVNNMNIHIETFKNLPLKLRIIRYILLTDAFANLLAIFMIYTGKLPFEYMIIAGINATVLGIGALLFAEYRIKRN